MSALTQAATPSSAPSPASVGWSPLLVVGLLWAVLAWCAALLAPRMAFWPAVEVLHILLPLITLGLTLAILVQALRQVWRGVAPLALLPNTTVQVILFTVLFFQFAAHLGAEHYKLERAPTTLDWLGFSLAHAVRAADILDIVEAYGLKIQVIVHHSWIVGICLVLFHLVVNVFILSLLAGFWAQGERWFHAHPDRWRLTVRSLWLGFALWLVVWALSALWLRPWHHKDIPLWYVDNLVRVIDSVDALDCFEVRLHQVPTEPLEGTLTFVCRLYMALGLGLVIAALYRWWTGRTEEEDTSSAPVSDRPLMESMCMAVVVLTLFLAFGSAIRLEAALPELQDAVMEADDERGEQALQALRRLGPTAASSVQALEQAVTAVPLARGVQITRTLGYLGPVAAEPLARLALGAEEEVAVAAVEGILQSGPAAAPQLARVWATAKLEATRSTAERCLSSFGSDAVLALMTTATEENLAAHLRWIQVWDRNWTLRSSTNRLIQGAQKVPPLLELLGSPDLSKRIAAARRLGEIGLAANEAVPALLQCLADKDSDVRSVGARALGQIGPAAKEAVPALIKRLADEDSHVRWAAAMALGQLGPAVQEAAPALRHLLTIESDKDVRQKAEEALPKIQPR